MKAALVFLSGLATVTTAWAQPQLSPSQTAMSGSSIAKLACSSGMQPVLSLMYPHDGQFERAAGAAPTNKQAKVFYRETATAWTVHIQEKPSGGAWQEVRGVPVPYSIECHP